MITQEENIPAVEYWWLLNDRSSIVSVDVLQVCSSVYVVQLVIT